MALSALVAAAVFALQPVGVFHYGEAVARNGEHWLALRVAPSQAALVDARVRVRRVHDVVVDEDGTDTGVEVTVAGPEASMLLRGPGLRAGPVAHARTDPAPAPLGETPLRLQLADAAYRVTLRCRPQVVGEQCDVVLDDGRHRQTLFTVAAGRYDDGSRMLGDDASPKLLFAGDLDRDGRLDLVLDTSDHYNVGRPTLFLSSRAKAGALVGRVASHESVGC